MNDDEPGWDDAMRSGPDSTGGDYPNPRIIERGKWLHARPVDSPSWRETSAGAIPARLLRKRHPALADVREGDLVEVRLPDGRMFRQRVTGVSEPDPVSSERTITLGPEVAS